MNECNFRFNALLQKQQKIMQLRKVYLAFFFLEKIKMFFILKDFIEKKIKLLNLKRKDFFFHLGAR